MSSKPKSKPLRILIIALASLLSLSLIAVGAVYVVTSSISSNSVPIVTTTPQPIGSPTPIPTPDLPIITGEPADIGEDYNEPVSTSSSAIEPTMKPTVEPTIEPTIEPIFKKVPIEDNVINILIIGQDIRPDQSGRGRSDTMMVLSYNRKEGKASIVSLMRDTWVPIKGHDWNRLNATFAFGGVGLTINTINDLFNLDVQDYIIVNFEGMTELVDKLGGVDVNITKVEAKYYNKNFGWNITSGQQHLNGVQALEHARNRKSNGGDFERVRRQQDIMLAVYKKLGEMHDPVLLAELTGFMMKNIKTNIAADALFTMGLEIVDKGNLEIQNGRMPADNTWRYANKDGRSVITIDFKKNTDYLHGIIYGMN